MDGLLQLSRKQREDLKTVLGIGESRLTEVLESNSVWKQTLTAAEVTSGISQIIGSEEEAKAVTDLMIQLQLLIFQFDSDPTAIAAAIAAGLASSLDIDDIEAWENFLPTFEKLLMEPVFERVAKVIGLSYEHSCLMQSARIITDIRPIFDRSRQAIEAAVISHTLRIRFDGSEGEHTLSFALDEEDIIKLSRQCEKAMSKAAIAAETMSKDSCIPTVVSGRAGTVTNFKFISNGS